MAVRLICADNATGHDGLRWRMGPDAQSVDIVVGETAPGVAELIITDPIEPEACFSVAAYSGQEESEKASVCTDTAVSVEEFDPSAAIGDYTGGGIYAGINLIDGTEYHIVAGKAESEEYGLQWKTSQTDTAGTGSASDGLANTLAMEAAGLADHPAAAHCLAYAGGGHDDWHMPARSQLALIHNNLRNSAEFLENTDSNQIMWSSTRRDATRAWTHRLSDDSQFSVEKDSLFLRVRPIRRVAV